MSLTHIPARFRFLLVALVAFAVIAAACSSSDDDATDADAADPGATAAQTEEPADAPAPAPAEGYAAPAAAEREQAQSLAQSQAQTEAQADSEPEATEVQVETPTQDEPSEEEAVAEGAGGTDADDGSDVAPAAAGNVGLGDLSAIQDLRFDGVIVLNLTPNAEGGDLELLAAFSDVTLEGGFIAPGDVELSIRLGDDAGFPPLGIISLGDTLYTNLGFGWEAQEGGAGGLLDLVDLSAFGVDPGAIDVEGVEDAGGLAGVSGLLPDDFSLDGWDVGGTEDRGFGLATRYSITTTSLEEFVERLLGGVTPADLAGEDSVLDLSALDDVDASADGAEIVIWIDEATGTLAAMTLDLSNVAIADFDDEGNALTIGLTSVQIELNPAFGLPVEILVVIDDLVIEGPDGASGNVRIEFRTFDLNAGSAEIEAPI